MNKTILLALGLVSVIGLTGCAAQQQSFGKTLEVSLNGGISRKVTFYAYDGKPVRVWEGKIVVESDEGNSLHFMDNGKRYTVSGLYTIEEI